MGDDLLNRGYPPAKKLFTEIFHEVFPFYLSIGMTYSQFWEEDICLVKYYRKAHEMQCERDNHKAWLQGAYFYDALCMASPLLRAFGKKSSRAQPYHKNPYGYEAKTQKPQDIKQACDIEATKFQAFAARFNKKFDNSRTPLSVPTKSAKGGDT